MKKETALIVNPIAGGRASRSKLSTIENFAQGQHIPVYQTKKSGHARELASELKHEFERLAVFGGDGTINEVASELVHHETALAIIPAGSGNGLANHLAIPNKTELALQYINKVAKPVDAIQVNQQIIVNVGGLGFDGHVARLFNESESRGLFTYLRLILSQLISFGEQDYSIQFEGKQQNGKAFMIAFANGSEFGNRFKINPKGDVANGKFSLIMVRKPPYHRLLPLLIDGFRGRLKESAYYKHYLLEELSISSPGATLHRDGEVSAADSAESLQLKVLPGALKIIY